MTASGHNARIFRFAERGFTLVEIMISMAIGLMLVLAMLASLQTAANGIRVATPAERDQLLLAFHLALADFEASYLPHLRFEECTVMPALNAVSYAPAVTGKFADVVWPAR